jgi:hypothetical protein
MKRTIFCLLIAALGLVSTVNAQNRNYPNGNNYPNNNNYPNGNNYPNNNGNNNYPQQPQGRYNDDDLYARCDNNRYGNYPVDVRNPFDTRSQAYDPRNPFDPRPVYDAYRHNRWNDYDYRNNANPFDYCENRRVWAERYYPLDSRNPYDIRNQYQNRRGNRYENDRRAPAVVIVPVPVPQRRDRDRGHHYGRNW